MMDVNECRVAKKMAKALAFMCLENHFRLPLYTGNHPISKVGDFTDVVVIDAEGNYLAWNQTCRVSFFERAAIVQDITDNLYDFLMNLETPDFSDKLEVAYRASEKWVDPKTGSEFRKRA